MLRVVRSLAGAVFVVCWLRFAGCFCLVLFVMCCSLWLVDVLFVDWCLLIVACVYVG